MNQTHGNHIWKRFLALSLSLVMVLSMALPVFAASPTPPHEVSIVVNAAGQKDSKETQDLSGITVNVYTVFAGSNGTEVTEKFEDFFETAETNYNALAVAPSKLYLTYDDSAKNLNISDSILSGDYDYIEISDPTIYKSAFASSLLSNIESNSKNARLIGEWLKDYAEKKSIEADITKTGSAAAKSLTFSSKEYSDKIAENNYYLITIDNGTNPYYTDDRAMLLQVKYDEEKTSDKGVNEINLKSDITINKEIIKVEDRNNTQKEGKISANGEYSINEIGDRITYRLTVYVPDLSEVDLTDYETPLGSVSYEDLVKSTYTFPFFAIKDTMTNLDINHSQTKIYIEGYPTVDPTESKPDPTIYPGYAEYIDVYQDGSTTDHVFAHAYNYGLEGGKKEIREQDGVKDGKKEGPYFSESNYNNTNVFALTSDSGYRYTNSSTLTTGKKSFDNEWYIIFDLKKLKEYGFDGQTIVIEYTANLNNDAVWENKNTATVAYDLKNGQSGEKENSTTSYTYGVDIKKEFLGGAAPYDKVSFELYKVETNENIIGKGDNANSGAAGRLLVVKDKDIYLSKVTFVQDIYYNGENTDGTDKHVAVDTDTDGYIEPGQYFVHDRVDVRKTTSVVEDINDTATTDKLTPDLTGHLKLYGLEPGTYYLVENAPDGYIPVTVKFTLVEDTSNYQLSIDDTDGSYAKYCLRPEEGDLYDEDKAELINGESRVAEVAERTYQTGFGERELMAFTITNVATFNLPFTGSDGIWLFVLCGVLVIAAGAYGIHRAVRKRG